LQSRSEQGAAHIQATLARADALKAQVKCVRSFRALSGEKPEARQDLLTVFHTSLLPMPLTCRLLAKMGAKVAALGPSDGVYLQIRNRLFPDPTKCPSQPRPPLRGDRWHGT
jgi:hypothetical protein